MQYSVFSTKSSDAGYRLDYFEVCNWGTFDKEIFKISPQGNTTLITGANGSGKTTFIQGLLTLLVPEKRFRFYEHQRTEESYVLGEYGDIETEAGGRQIQRLRDDKSKAYSILLASFKSEDKFITLVQARWFSGTEMKRKYIIAFKPLRIDDDIKPIDPKGDWLKRLHKKYPKQGTKDIILPFDDGPSKYAETLLKAFGMRSPKALTLFDQTMRLKVLGSLDEFVRHNMLEESRIEDDFQALRGNYQKLLDAHREMQKAEKQLELLKPVIANANDLNTSLLGLEKLLDFQNTHPKYFNYHEANFLISEVEKESLDLKKISDKESSIKGEIENYREKEKGLDADIKSDETGKLIQELEREIRLKNSEKDKQYDKLTKYNKAASKLNLEINPSEDLFFGQISKANQRNTEIESELKDKENGIQKRLRVLENEKEIGEKQYGEKSKELEELLKQKNNITGRVSEIRQEILLYTNANEKEIPFIGELIQVLPNERAWEMAIEKVLHSFALRLIVPEKYYSKVNEYVNDNNLRGRIIYERFKDETYINSLLTKERDSLLSKIEIKRQSLFSDWIENQIRAYYDYICTDKENLPAYNKAFTITGLIKSGTRHEKDDRSKTLSRENYVLGWDNKEKIRLTKETLKQIDASIKTSKEKISTLEKQQTRLERDKEEITKFVQFDSYIEIDWQSLSLEIQNLSKKKEQLETSNNRIKLLKEELKKLQEEITSKEVTKDQLVSERTRKGDWIDKLKAQQEDCNKYLDENKVNESIDKFPAFEEKFKRELKDFNFENLEATSKKIAENLEAEIKNEGQRQVKIKLDLQAAMQSFKRPDDEVMKEFKDWTSDTHKLGDNIQHVDDYIEIYERIEREELIELKAKFKKYLNEDMIEKMADFKTLLDSQEEQIKDSIDALNESLKNIDFKKNPKTFIQLFAVKNSNADLDKFRASLVDWKPNVSEYETTKDEQILEASFKKIKVLIDTLNEKEEYRKYVTDVRNWLRFLAKEFYREDLKRPPKIYDNTGKLSSGEQAQITYTIMGAAIAYQYGILKDGLTPNSFRFICVDEAFAKQDEEKAEYLMDLARKLSLQMLLVTPDDKIQIAEPYISAVHVVHRINNRHSRIFDTTIEQAKKLSEEKKLTTSDYNK